MWNGPKCQRMVGSSTAGASSAFYCDKVSGKLQRKTGAVSLKLDGEATKSDLE